MSERARGQLPPLVGHGRGRLLTGLILAGATLATLSVGAAQLIALLHGAADAWSRWLLVAGLLLLVAAVAGVRVIERILAERLGQHYVQDVRMRLLGGVLSGSHRNSLGITLARATNDLNSVRNWITLGIAALAVGVPLIIAVTVALWFMSPLLAVAVLVPMLLLSCLLGLLARPAYYRSRALRKRRGRLAAQIADTVAAVVSVRTGGGVPRELRRLEAQGREVARAAVARAAVSGALRAGSAAAATTSAVAVVAAGTSVGIEPGTVMAALTVVGIVAGPIHELGRCVEYRQSYRAARRALAPALAPGDVAARAFGAESTGSAEQASAPPADAPAAAGVVVGGLELPGQREPLSLIAARGERIRVRGERSEATTAAFFDALLGLRDEPGLFAVDGSDVLAAGPRERRALIGFARRGLPLERGTIARAVRYRHPEHPEDSVRTALEAAGMRGVDGLARAERTVLRFGGEPLGVSDRAKVQVARAMLLEPPLLLLDHVDADLDADGIRALSTRLTAYPGTVIFASDAPEQLVEAWTEVFLDR